MAETQKMLLCPTGRVATSITGFCLASASIQVDDNGVAAQAGFGEFPDFDDLTTPEGQQFLLDDEGTEFLYKHCRLVDAPKDFDTWSEDPIEPWPAEVIAACARVANLSNVLWLCDRLPKWAPKGWTDSTIEAVIANVLVGRTQAEIDTLEKQIAEFRRGRVEPTEIANDRPVDAECSDCDWVGWRGNLKQIKDITQRVAPGEPMPAGECPACGALAHLIEEKTDA